MVVGGNSVDTTGAGQPAPFVLSIDGEIGVLSLSCKRCGATVTVRSPLDTKTRVFLKTLLRGKIPALPETVDIACDRCEREAANG